MSITHAEALNNKIKLVTNDEVKVSDRTNNNRRIRVWVDAGMRTGRVKVKGLGKGNGNLYMVDEVLSNPTHYLSGPAAAIRKAGGVAFVVATIGGKSAQIMILAEEWAAAKAKIGEQAASVNKAHQELNAATKAWDELYNEGCDGYNPYDKYR